MVESDEALVVRSQSGDRAAFEQLVRRTARLVFARVYPDVGGDSHRAEDLVQETFLTAWRSIGQVDDPAGFRPWLLKVARTTTLDAVRRDARKKRAGPKTDFEQASLRLADAGPSPPEQVEREEGRQRVLALLRDLPEEYRLPLTLRYLGGADYDAIGRQLGLSNGSLRGLLNRGMAKLREAMR